MKIFAIYKGDKFLFEGTSRECAKHFGVKMETVQWWNTKANKRRTKGNRKIAIVIEERKNEF